MKEIDKLYIDRAIESLVDDKENWQREVMCGMEGCFIDCYSPSYIKDGIKISFSDRYGLTAYIDGNREWEIGFWDLYNPFSNRARKLDKAFNNMRLFHVKKERKEKEEKLKSAIK